MGWNLGVLCVYFAGEHINVRYARELVRDTEGIARELRVGAEIGSELLLLEKDFLGKGSRKCESLSVGAVRLQRIEENLRACADKRSYRYIPIEARELNVEKLILEGARGFVGDSTCWEFLTDEERRDLDEAGWALLAGCATASVLLSLRVVESLLRRYYRLKSGEVLTTISWGKILEELRKDVGRKRKLPGAEATVGKPLLDLLTWLKDVRDSVAHPEQRLAQEDAEAVFLTVANEVLGKMTTALAIHGPGS